MTIDSSPCLTRSTLPRSFLIDMKTILVKNRLRASTQDLFIQYHLAQKALTSVQNVLFVDLIENWNEENILSGSVETDNVKISTDSGKVSPKSVDQFFNDD